MAALTSRRARIAVAVLVVVLLVAAPLFLPAIVNQSLVRIGVYAVAVLGLNIVMGYTGQVNLGQIFFLGLGAYVTAYGVTHGWNIVLVFVAAAVITGIVGLLVALAAARLGGLAIAMVTIALPIVGVPLAKRLDTFTGAPRAPLPSSPTPPTGPACSTTSGSTTSSCSWPASGSSWPAGSCAASTGERSPW
ncbi:ABC transporter permease subunit [Sinomonas atrocyanea]